MQSHGWLLGVSLFIAACGSSPNAARHPDGDASGDAADRGDSPIDIDIDIDIDDGAGAGGAESGSGGSAGSGGSPDAAIDPGSDTGAGGVGGMADGSVAPDGEGDANRERAPCIGNASLCGTTLLLEARHLVYDASRGRLYVSIQGGAAQHPNTITSIDPQTASVTDAIPIGSDPDSLALSDDASTLWVGMIGSFSLRKVTLTGAAPVVGPLRMLPPQSASKAGAYPQQLAALADGADTIAAVVAGNPSYNIGVYDDGARRPTVVAASLGTLPALAGGPPGVFFGAGTSSLHIYAASPDGVTKTSFPGLLSDGGGIFYAQGRVYAGKAVIDVSNLAAPARVGTLPLGGLIAPHSAQRLVMLSSPDATITGQWELRLIETETFTQRGAIGIPASLVGNGGTDQVLELAYVGGDAVALLIDSNFSSAAASSSPNRVVILHARMLANDGGSADGGAGGAVGGGGSGGGGGTSGTGGSPGDLCAGCTLQKLDVAGLHMTYDRARSRLYTVLTSDAPHDPNTLISIDGTSGTVLATVPIDPSPRQMALSDDGATLWVGFDMGTSIRKFSVANTPPVAGLKYPLPPTTSNGTSVNAVAIDLEPLAEAPTSIAACINGIVGTRVAILDDGVARPTIDATRLFVSKLARGPAGVLFGYDGQSAGFTFTSYSVDTTGVSLLSAQDGLLAGYQNDIHYYQGRGYADFGEVIDVSSPARPYRIGKYAFQGVITPHSSKRMLMLTDGASTGTLQLRILETENFTQVASLSLGKGFSGFPGSVDLVYLGGDGVAFINAGAMSARNLFIFRSPTIATPP